MQRFGKAFSSTLGALLLLFIVTSYYDISARAETPKEAQTIRIQDLEKDYGLVESYIVEILGLAIKKSGEAYVLEKLSGAPVPQARQILDISQNRGNFDVIWSMTSDERETQMLPIRIPIDKGLFGWRIAFINPEQAKVYASIKSVKDLAKLNAGQGYLWPDTEILRSNGLPVVTGSDETLLHMLKAKRFDYFPRSTIAIWDEQKKYSELNLEIDSNFVLHYQTAFYFFVAPSRKKLAEDLNRGLERAIADGSFEIIFNRYFQSFIRQADLKNRQILELKNPLVSLSALPLKRAELWYHP